MPLVAKPTLQCAQCGKRYVWNPAMAGKRVKCNCGTLLTPPTETEPAFDGPPPMSPIETKDLYDLIEPPKPAPTARVAVPVKTFLAPLELDDDGLCCPACDHAMEPGRVICTACSFNFRTGQRPAPPAAPRKQIVAPPKAAVPKLRVPTMSPPQPPRERYSTEKAEPPVRLILAGAMVLLLIGGGFLWHALSAPAMPVLNSGKGEDPEVNELIADSGATELHRWFAQDPHRIAGEFSTEQAIAKADELQAMGAKKVLSFGSMMSLALAIELPDDPAKRAALFKWENRFALDHFYKPDKDVGQHYLLLRLHP